MENMMNTNSKSKKPLPVVKAGLKALTPEENLKLKVRERTEVWVRGGDESALDFCAYVAEGGHMANYCRERGLKYHTVYNFFDDDPARSEMYARAKQHRADVLADEIVAIADEAVVETKYEGEEVRLVLDSTAVARNRLRVDARKWVASKLRPGTYGDKLTQEHTGAGGGPITLAALDLKNMSDGELAQMHALLSKASGQ